jgi:polyisoprenoid-binding protein YceI
MENRFIFALALAASATCLPSSALEFDFKDPKGVNNIVFKTDAPLESINGTASGVSGKVTFDPANPSATKGKIVLETASLHVGNPTMKEHLHSGNWMDVAKFPQIVFDVTGINNAKTEKNRSGQNVTTAEATGTMSIKGITKPMTIPVQITHLPGRLKERTPGKEGDLLVLRSQFSIKRSDFGISAGKGEDKVSDQIDLSLSIAGASPR